MSTLLIYIGENERFDANKVKRDLEQVPGVEKLQVDNFGSSLLQCDYNFNGDSTILRLADDLAIISVDGTGDASLQIALELQKREERQLHLTNYNYVFDLPLNNIHSVDELRREIRIAYKEAVA